MLYWETFEILDRLSDAQAVQLLKVIRKFAENGEASPQIAADPLLDMAWTCIAPKLIADDIRYKEIQRKNQVNALTRSFKSTYAPAHGLDPSDKEALHAYVENRLAETESHRMPWQPTADTTTTTDTASEPDTDTKTNTSSISESDAQDDFQTSGFPQAFAQISPQAFPQSGIFSQFDPLSETGPAWPLSSQGKTDSSHAFGMTPWR